MKDKVKVRGMLNEKGAAALTLEVHTDIKQVILSILKKNSMLFALIFIIVVFSITTEGIILVPRNISNLIFQNAYIAILAVGMLLCILTGGNIDLSVGSSVCLVGAIAGELMINRKMPVLPSIVLCLILGLLIGVWQGFWIAFIGIPPFIATLAGQLVFRGLSLIVLQGLTLAPFPQSFLNLASGHITDYFPIKSINLDITCVVFGVVAALVFLAIKITGRFRKIKKGYPTGKPLFFYLGTALTALLIIIAAFGLTLYEGISKYFSIQGIALIIACIAFGVVLGLVFLAIMITGRFRKIKKGNTTVKALFFYIGTVLTSLLIAFSAFLFARYEGLPDYLNIENLNITCIAFGVVAALIFLAIKVSGRFRKIKKGYATGKALFFYIGTALTALLIIFASFWLARYEGLPTVMITLIIVVIVYAILTSMTVPGRYLYALGGNPKAARMSGIDTKKVMFFAYANMSFLAGVAGLVFSIYLRSATPTAGQNFELDAIASCFIGGASAYGGIGTVGGVLIGAAFMGIMNNGMNFMGFDTAAMQVVKGMVLLLAVAFDVISKRKSR